MSRKRTKEIRAHSSKVCRTDEMVTSPEELRNFSDVKEAMGYLRDLFPLEKFNNRLPPMFFHHQLYGTVKNRTLVDQEIDKLMMTCEVRLFKLSSNPKEVCIVFTKDYVSHVTNHLKNFNVPQCTIDVFVNEVVLKIPDMNLTKSQFINLGLDESDIRNLIGISVLSVRDVGSWWMTVPNSGLFLMNLEKGRKILTNHLKRTKFKEILLTDLGQRPFHKSVTLGLMYHLYDLIGEDLVECIQTSSNVLLRLV